MSRSQSRAKMRRCRSSGQNLTHGSHMDGPESTLSGHRKSQRRTSHSGDFAVLHQQRGGVRASFDLSRFSIVARIVL